MIIFVLFQDAENDESDSPFEDSEMNSDTGNDDNDGDFEGAEEMSVSDRNPAWTCQCRGQVCVARVS